MMTFKNSLALMFIFATPILLSSFAKYTRAPEPPANLCNTDGPHKFLCDQKINIKHASVSDFTLVDGISQNLARKIVKFIEENPKSSVDELIDVKGVGKKTLVKIMGRFY